MLPRRGPPRGCRGAHGPTARRVILLRDGEVVEDTTDIAHAFQTLHEAETADSLPPEPPAESE